jgi:hypothetical protein
MKMRKPLLLAAFIFIAIASFGQARSVTAEYQKISQPAMEIEIPFPEKTVVKSFIDYFERLGYKGKETKGYYTFKEVRLPKIGPGIYDIYFKADRKSRREKDNTILTFLLSNGYEKFLSGSENDSVINNAKQFLNEQQNNVAAFDLEMQITAQDEITKKEEKRLANLLEDGVDLVKKKEKIESEIQDNIQKKAAQKAELEKQMLIFETLKNKRKQ